MMMAMAGAMMSENKKLAMVSSMRAMYCLQ
jgi:hypothetical protein